MMTLVHFDEADTSDAIFFGLVIPAVLHFRCFEFHKVV